ncbi:amidohydrolase family protein [Bordetella sp. BOR01]|uniref:metal-dependent hydrolase family protein n=1 Tax=Bordetella sp. BOR01 TaxID=2854779 RepID=UPI001C45337E|nr:amidohydrolase family protein [Bordetella sp. BOR01]MBV7486060.1 amidohydrolase family protein [Bordetella sp. BOR01]
MPVLRSIFLGALLCGGSAIAHDWPSPQDAAGADGAAGNAKAPASLILFENVRVFDGTSPTLSGPGSVLVRGNVIEKVAQGQVSAEGARVIDGGGRTLMPGLIDAHWHSMFVGVPIGAALTADAGYLNIVAGIEARKTLMRGFTTVRDVGGAVFGLKNAIDRGVIPGPRIYPSGAMISVTGGHGDFRNPSDLPRTQGEPASRHDIAGDSAIADSPDEVRLRVREQLMHGASQIKLTGGGGVSSPHSPLDVVTFSEAELRAAVQSAADWGTYVAVHAYTPEAIQRAIRAGVQSIEHGSLMDEETARKMAETGTWLSTQAFPDELADAFPRGSNEWEKAQEVFAGTDSTYRLAVKYKLKTAFGTDILFSSALAAQQGRLLASLTRWYSPAETLIMATGTNAQLLALSGKRNPYPGELGVVREGALADLLLVDGNPLENIALIGDPDKNFVLIMKDGAIVKDALAAH